MKYLILFFTPYLLYSQFNTATYFSVNNVITIDNSNLFNELEFEDEEVEFKELNYDLYYNNDLSHSDIEEKHELKKMFSYPLDKLRITSNFGYRNHPIENVKKFHNGVDFRANNDTVYSILNGEVIEAGYKKKNGHYIVIKHQNYKSYYLHLNKYFYLKGDKIKAGQVIGISGNTGSSTGPHLHFAIKREDKWINPIKFLQEINNHK